MTLSVDDLVEFSGKRPSAAIPARRDGLPRDGRTRREFLRYIVAAGSGTAIAMFGIFPQAREAAAACVPDGSGNGCWIAGSCNGIGYSNCTSCCCSPICTACCTTDKYHKNNSYPYYIRYDECHNIGGGGSFGPDGWIWHVCTTGCTGGKKKKYRCHDGWICGEVGCGPEICVNSYGCV